MAALIASGYRLGHSYALFFSLANQKKQWVINVCYALVVQKNEGEKKNQMCRSRIGKKCWCKEWVMDWTFPVIGWNVSRKATPYMAARDQSGESWSKSRIISQYPVSSLTPSILSFHEIWSRFISKVEVSNSYLISVLRPEDGGRLDRLLANFDNK